MSIYTGQYCPLAKAASVSDCSNSTASPSGGRRTRRRVALFDFTAPRRESRWLLIERGEATACDEETRAVLRRGA